MFDTIINEKLINISDTLKKIVIVQEKDACIA
jgi:hypothetical protein